jgi:hypothetical protein
MDQPNGVVLTPCYGGMVSALYASSMMKLYAACAARPANKRSSRMLARVSTRAHRIKPGKRQQRHQQGQGEHHQGDLTDTGDHPVIDLQHVERRARYNKLIARLNAPAVTK